MNRRIYPSALIPQRSAIVLTVGVLLFAIFQSAEAQQANKISHVGFLSISSLAANTTRIAAFRQGLQDLGYVEGKNIVIEWRYAEEKQDRLRELASELVN